MNTTTPKPWGLTHVTPLDPSTYIDMPHAELDPETQTGRYFDPMGQPIEAGKHGTNKPTNRPTKTSGSDGDKPSSDDDNTTDYGND